jgi:hypothetical protein
MISVQNGNLEMCRLLIANGAVPSINTPDNVNIWYNSYYIIYKYISKMKWVILVYAYVSDNYNNNNNIYFLGWQNNSYDECWKWKYGNL